MHLSTVEKFGPLRVTLDVYFFGWFHAERGASRSNLMNIFSVVLSDERGFVGRRHHLPLLSHRVIGD